MYSSLAKGIIPTSNASKRVGKISTVTIHHCAGFSVDGRSTAESFSRPARGASANYCIGQNGDIWASADETTQRSWCTSTGNGTDGNRDQNSVTIELANITGAPDWEVGPETIESCIQLCVDICKRNNIPELRWSDDPAVRRTGEHYVPYHSDWAATQCPGNFLKKKIPEYIIPEINRRLKGEEEVKPVKPEQPIKSNLQVAREIWYGVNGKNPWGNGAERKQKLEAAGYVYADVQSLVNQLAHKMIR